MASTFLAIEGLLEDDEDASCQLKVALQRLPLQGSNLFFPLYYCLPLIGPSNRDQFFKLMQNLNFNNQSLPRFYKIKN